MYICVCYYEAPPLRLQQQRRGAPMLSILSLSLLLLVVVVVVSILNMLLQHTTKGRCDTYYRYKKLRLQQQRRGAQPHARKT